MRKTVNLWPGQHVYVDLVAGKMRELIEHHHLARQEGLASGLSPEDAEAGAIAITASNVATLVLMHFKDDLAEVLRAGGFSIVDVPSD